MRLFCLGLAIGWCRHDRRHCALNRAKRAVFLLDDIGFGREVQMGRWSSLFAFTPSHAQEVVTFALTLSASP